ncbi:MAG: hypothetical protein ABSF45_23850 [Terriglobia bacterium]
MSCSICGKPRGFFAGLFGAADHPACIEARDRKLREEARAKERQKQEEAAAHLRLLMERTEKGIFASLNGQSEMLLDRGETLCAMFKGCWSTLFYPRAVGRAAPGQAVRVDGLKKSDYGTLHITDKRVCFIVKGGAKAIPLKKLLQCEARGDTLHLTAQGRASSSYFIIESPPALELAHAAIMKLRDLAKSGKWPVIDNGG